jgi:tRNA threonylcarbamoyladenosine biosynthesis protein TsaB
MAEVDAYAVMSGPGSFTGVRVGLTTVKAWAEVYGKPIVALSRLEAIASRALHGTAYVAAFADANRGYVYGAVYRRSEAGLTALGDEMVFAPEKFVAAAADLAAGERISWASTDADAVLADAAWEGRKKLNEQIEQVSPFLAETLARLAVGRLAVGQSTDALALDANYVRRPDAEMFWKDTKAHGR